MMSLFLGRSLSVHLLMGVLLMWVLSETLRINLGMAWFAAINIIAFCSFGWDKACAKAGWGRTPEMTYHLVGVAGGFPGIFAGRKVFNHKTSKLGFIIPMWIFFALQMAAATWFFTDIEQVVTKMAETRAAQKAQQASQTAPQPSKK